MASSKDEATTASIVAAEYSLSLHSDEAQRAIQDAIVRLDEESLNLSATNAALIDETTTTTTTTTTTSARSGKSNDATSAAIGVFSGAKAPYCYSDDDEDDKEDEDDEDDSDDDDEDDDNDGIEDEDDKDEDSPASSSEEDPPVEGESEDEDSSLSLVAAPVKGMHSQPPPRQQQRSNVVVSKPKGKTTGKSNRRRRGRNDIIRQMGDPPLVLVPMSSADGGRNNMAMLIPTALLPQGNIHWDSRAVCRMCLDISRDVSTGKMPVVVLLLSSGRFAGAVFEGDRCVVHRALTRYTVRRGQGGAQSSLDSSKGKAKSMGAQLRRAGEASLREDVKSTLLNWRRYMDDAALIFVSCPKTMRRGMHDDKEIKSFFPRNDARIRRVPLAVGRPSFESACAVKEVMTRIVVRAMTDEEVAAAATAAAASAEKGRLPESGVVGEKHDSSASATTETTSKMTPTPAEIEAKAKKNVVAFEPLTPLHEAAALADLETLIGLLGLCSDASDGDGVAGGAPLYDVDARAGETEMTPLHFAASSATPSPLSSTATATAAADPTRAAECVSALLVRGNADPTVLDGRFRPPYFVAHHEKIRDAFRMARATLGEDRWDWDAGAKVGPPLGMNDLDRRKAKAADKKRRQKARQKEKRSKEKAEAEEEERRKREEEERNKKEEDARRIRAGLMPKSAAASAAAANVCDFCQKECKRRSQMFNRLEYVYCTTDCVKRHQRELTAGAALARLGG